MYKRVEEYLDINDSRVWFDIPGYNGYQMSQDGFVRSMKHYKKYPYGILLTPTKVTGNTAVYSLTNSQNKRVNINSIEINKLIMEDDRSLSYPHRTSEVYTSSRNQRCTITPSLIQSSNNLYHPKFTIIGGK